MLLKISFEEDIDYLTHSGVIMDILQVKFGLMRTFRIIMVIAIRVVTTNTMMAIIAITIMVIIAITIKVIIAIAIMVIITTALIIISLLLMSLL